MNEEPIFVPVAGEHLAAILCLPESDPRAVVVLLQGVGAPRSHKNRVWTRVARELAERDVASVRYDYPEIGDSTGALDAISPVDQALGVAEFAMRATGVERFGVVGNCRGARTGLGMAVRAPACSSLGLVLLGSPKQVLARGGQSAAGSALRDVARRAPRLRRRARRLLHTERRTPRFRFSRDALAAVGSADVLFLLLGRADIGEGLRLAVSDLAAESDRRVEARTEVVLGTSGFRIPAAHQPFVIQTIVDWMDQTVPPSVHPLVPSAGESA